MLWSCFRGWGQLPLPHLVACVSDKGGTYKDILMLDLVHS